MEYVEGEKIKKSYMAKVGYCYGSALTNEKCCSFDTKQKADFTIICRNKSYAVHRALICAHSEFFDGACRNAFRELENGMVDLSEDDPESIDHMIDCMSQTFRPVASTNIPCHRFLPLELPVYERRHTASGGAIPRESSLRSYTWSIPLLT